MARRTRGTAPAFTVKCKLCAGAPKDPPAVRDVVEFQIYAAGYNDQLATVRGVVRAADEFGGTVASLQAVAGAMAAPMVQRMGVPWQAICKINGIDVERFADDPGAADPEKPDKLHAGEKQRRHRLTCCLGEDDADLCAEAIEKQWTVHRAQQMAAIRAGFADFAEEAEADGLSLAEVGRRAQLVEAFDDPEILDEAIAAGWYPAQTRAEISRRAEEARQAAIKDGWGYEPTFMATAIAAGWSVLQAEAHFKELIETRSAIYRSLEANDIHVDGLAEVLGQLPQTSLQVLAETVSGLAQQ